MTEQSSSASPSGPDAAPVTQGPTNTTTSTATRRFSTGIGGSGNMRLDRGDREAHYAQDSITAGIVLADDVGIHTGIGGFPAILLVRPPGSF